MYLKINQSMKILKRKYLLQEEKLNNNKFKYRQELIQDHH